MASFAASDHQHAQQSVAGGLGQPRAELSLRDEHLSRSCLKERKALQAAFNERLGLGLLASDLATGAPKCPVSYSG